MRKRRHLREIKEKTQALLGKEELTIPVFCYFLVLVLAFGGTFLFSWHLSGLMLALVGENGAQIRLLLAGAVLVFISLLFLFPCALGLKTLFFNAILFGRIDFRMVFYSFSTRRRYKVAFLRGVRGLFRFVLFFLLFCLMATLGRGVGDYLYDSGHACFAVLIVCLTAIFLFLLPICFFLLRADLFLLDVIFLSAPSLTYRQARALSARRMKRKKRYLYRLFASFIPLWLLSFLLLGFPFLFLIPYYLGARAYLAAHLICD